MEPYLTFDVISMRYKDKGTSLMTSQWRFRPPSAFLTATVRPSNTVSLGAMEHDPKFSVKVFFLCWLFIYGMPIVISRGVWRSHRWAIWEIQDGRQYGRQHLGDLWKLDNFHNIWRRVLILVSIPTFLGTSNYMECITFWLEHDEKHNFNIKIKKMYGLNKCAYFLVFLTKISIIRVLSPTDVWVVNIKL